MPKIFVRINSDICTNITNGSLFVRKRNVFSVRQNRILEYYLRRIIALTAFLNSVLPFFLAFTETSRVTSKRTAVRQREEKDVAFLEYNKKRLPL
jgi:hypothetical protein